jgi:hypothetical protein
MEVRGIVERTGARCLLLSGTPTPESFAQFFHQAWATGRGPWDGWKEFYAWHKDLGKSKTQWIAGREVKIYSDVKEAEVMAAMQPYIISFTQAEGWL